jgi:ribosomal-protein-alanine N-acetyltransferase
MMIRLPFMRPKRRDFSIARLTSEDTPDIARLHREDFVRPWTDDEFTALLSQDTVFGFTVLETGRASAGPAGFVLARLAAGEGEILTIAVARAHRRQGLGWQLMDAVLRELHSERAEALFLEVDESNVPALQLYRRLGFREVGKRPAYYQTAGKGRSGALVMRRDLR